LWMSSLFGMELGNLSIDIIGWGADRVYHAFSVLAIGF